MSDKVIVVSKSSDLKKYDSKIDLNGMKSGALGIGAYVNDVTEYKGISKNDSIKIDNGQAIIQFDSYSDEGSSIKLWNSFDVMSSEPTEFVVVKKAFLYNVDEFFKKYEECTSSKSEVDYREKAESLINSKLGVSESVFDDIRDSSLFKDINKILGIYYIDNSKLSKSGRDYLLPLDMTKLTPSTQSPSQYFKTMSNLHKISNEVERLPGRPEFIFTNNSFVIKVDQNLMID